MSDPKVLETQVWLNATYSYHSQWNHVMEDGFTGWGTIFGLIRGLQIELGISTLADNFGTGTMNAFVSQFGSVGPTTANTDVIKLVQGALWCKGFSGGYTWGQYDNSVSISVMQVTAAMGLTQASTVAPKVLKSLMSMDAYTLIGAGTSEKRAVQQWLNGKYSHRSAFNILPCDGLFSRNVQQGMMYAIQYELNMSDSVANGNFGPGTKSGIQNYGGVAQGSVDYTKNWVRLFQGALRFNDYEGPFSGTFDAATTAKTEAFQTYAELPVHGSGDYRTWASLLISTGDETRPGAASDMATQLTPALCNALYANGYRTVGRYLSVNGKRYAPGELQTIFNAGLETFPIMQEANTSAADFSYAKGRDHGFQAARRLRQLGFRAGTTVFFAVDYDATDDGITSLIIPYFEGIRDVLASVRVSYRVGIYGTRNVCTRVINAGLAFEAFIASMSWGWSGNLGYRLPPSWTYDQIQNLVLPGTSMQIDKNVQSVRAHPVGQFDIDPTPLPGGQFDETYFWYLTELTVRAEMAETSDTGDIADELVLHYLQKPKYWTGGNGSSFPPGAGDAFTVYEPISETLPGLPSAMRSAIALARSSFESAVQPPSSAVQNRVDHWAACARGYRTWAGVVPATGSTCTLGDLGGWALDLVQAWNSYKSGVPSSPVDIRQWFAAYVGSNTVDVSFGYVDLLGDVDGYLVDRMLRDTPNRSLSDCVREIEVRCGFDPRWRFQEFLSGRFGGQWSTAAGAATDVFTSGLIWTQLPKSAFLNVADPTASEAIAIGEGFADALLARTV